MACTAKRYADAEYLSLLISRWADDAYSYHLTPLRKGGRRFLEWSGLLLARMFVCSCSCSLRHPSWVPSGRKTLSMCRPCLSASYGETASPSLSLNDHPFLPLAKQPYSKPASQPHPSMTSQPSKPHSSSSHSTPCFDDQNPPQSQLQSPTIDPRAPSQDRTAPSIAESSRRPKVPSEGEAGAAGRRSHSHDSGLRACRLMVPGLHIPVRRDGDHC